MEPIKIVIGKDTDAFLKHFGLEFLSKNDAADTSLIGKLKIHFLQTKINYFLTKSNDTYLYLYQPSAYLSDTEYGDVLYYIRNRIPELKSQKKQIVIITFNDFSLNLFGNWINYHAGGINQYDVAIEALTEKGDIRRCDYNWEGVLTNWEIDYFGHCAFYDKTND